MYITSQNDALSSKLITPFVWKETEAAWSLGSSNVTGVVAGVTD